MRRIHLRYRLVGPYLVPYRLISDEDPCWERLRVETRIRWFLFPVLIGRVWGQTDTI